MQLNINSLLILIIYSKGTLNESMIVIIVNSMKYKALQVLRNEMHRLHVFIHNKSIFF